MIFFLFKINPHPDMAQCAVPEKAAILGDQLLLATPMNNPFFRILLFGKTWFERYLGQHKPGAFPKRSPPKLLVWPGSKSQVCARQR
jgi:hypothetical protein